MNAFFRPATALLIRMGYRSKLPILASLFCVPLAIAVVFPPASWLAPSALAIAATLAFAWYCMGAHIAAADEAWDYVQGVAGKLADHDLREIESDRSRSQAQERIGSGHFGRLHSTLVDTHERLRELVTQARASADAARVAADELAAGNVNLSQRTEQQASTLEETASGMEELAATVKQNADNCKLASELSGNAAGIAKKGADLVYRIVSTMELIDKSSKKIVDIISVIESIAFQTNILALNAAVEAARAGEQGRGFAVVAGEVRNLAQRSAEAAKEIKGLIGDSVGNVDQGAKLTSEAGHIINDVVVSVQQVNELIREIAVASREQSSGVEEMNKALTQLEGMTQQNAALVEEAAASALTFKDESAHLSGLVGQFRLDEGAVAAPEPQPAARKRQQVAAATASTPRELAYRKKPQARATRSGKNSEEDDDMKALLAPGMAIFIRMRNNVKLPLLAILYTVPLVIYILANPPAVWATPTHGLVLAAYVFAWYCGASHYYSADEAWTIVRGIAGRLNDRDLRGGDLMSKEEVRERLGEAQFASLFGTLVDAHDRLRELVGLARTSADAARIAADELAAGNVNLSQRTEQQATTLEETASGMEELAATVRQNADNCKLASDLSGNATGVANKGAALVHRIVTTMEMIDKSSKKIVDIIGVIESIAFQTNILALNAAVEAARAGEQGRGFAVVAGEVRSLAQRSAEAAKEIKSLIGDSVGNVDQGAKLVGDAGHIMNDVVVSVQQVKELISEIAVASREQSSGVEEMNKALMQLEGMTQQNAALVEEAAASALTFKEESAHLAGLVGQFQMEEGSEPPAAPAPARAQSLPKSEGAPARELGYRKPAKPGDDEWQEF